MIDIKSVHILNENEEILFQQEFYAQGSKNLNCVLFSGVVMAIQNFMQVVVEKTSQELTFEGSKFFFTKNEDLIFIIRTDLDTTNKKIFQLLAKIEKEFISKFKKYLSSPEEIRIHILAGFKLNLCEILRIKSKTKALDFYNSIR